MAASTREFVINTRIVEDEDRDLEGVRKVNLDRGQERLEH